MTKCFICNQVFYSQKLFDSHMKDHQSKISRTNHDEMARKTMESFRVKKNNMNSSGKIMPLNKTINHTTTTQESQELKKQ